jgi:hypothetical protein
MKVMGWSLFIANLVLGADSAALGHVGTALVNALACVVLFHMLEGTKKPTGSR